MATDNQTESSHSENQELPTPEFSEEGASSTSGGADETVSKLTPVIQEIVKREVQSTKDKRISRIEKSMGRLGLLEELEEQGVSIPKDVRTEMQIRELQEQMQQRPQSPVQTGDNGMSQRRTAVTEAITELQKHELDPNDAGFIELLRGKYANRAEFDLKVSRYIVGKLSPPKPASPADVVQAPAKGGSSGTKESVIITEYQEKLAKIPRGNAMAVSNLKAEYRKKARENGFILNI